jgi:hypothetical protein
MLALILVAFQVKIFAISSLDAAISAADSLATPVVVLALSSA